MGDKPDNFREMSIGMAEMGYKGIDLNMGCPVPNVASKGKGSGLILRPEVAAEIIQAAKAGGIPVSVKTRLGYSNIDEWRDWLKHVFEQDIANLSIHLRTRKEMSKVDAHWELIGEIKKLRDEIAPDTMLTINGDIPDREAGLKLVEEFGVDGVMIGRGIFKNPFAFEKSLGSTAVGNCWTCYDCSWICMINIQNRNRAPSSHCVDSLKFTCADSGEPVN